MSRLNQEQTDSQRAAATFPVYLAYAVLVLLYFSPHLLGLASFSANDFTQLFLPFSMFQLDALLGMRLPVWDPHTNSGHPYLADPQAAVFYPVSNALLLLTGFLRGAAGRLYLLQVEAALHVFLACCFAYAFVRRLTGQRLAAFASGLIFGFSGYLAGYPPLQLSILRTAVWLPLILLLLLPRESRNPGWKSWLAAAAVHAVAFYAGHPQTFLFMTYVVGGWILMLGLIELAHSGIRMGGAPPGIAGQGNSVSTMLRFSGRSLLYVASLIALCLAQLWPTWEFTQHSVRFFVPSDYLKGGFEWEDSWQFLFPGLLTEFSPQYVGIIGLGLAVAAVLAMSSPALLAALDKNLGRGPAFFFIVYGVAAILLSYGAKGPIYGLFIRFAPGGDLFRGQERAIYVAIFSLSVLAGYGLAVLPALAGRLRRFLGWTLVGATLAGAVLFLFFWLIPSRSGASVPSFLLAAVPALLFASCFAKLCGAKRITRTGLLLLPPLLVGELFIAGFATNLSDGPQVRASLDSNVAEATLDASLIVAEERAGPAARVFNEFRLQDSSGIFFGWEDVWGSSPMRLFYYDTLFHTFPLHRMWELTGVGTVVSWREKLPVASRTLAEFAAGEEASRVHQIDSISPRWWWAQRARRNVADRDAPALLADPNVDLKSEILVAESDADILGPGWDNDRLSFGSGGSASVRAEQVGLAHLRFEVDSDQEGLLFVSENWLPGWKARWSDAQVGGSSWALPIVRAHQAFLGIPTPAGAGTLDLRYRPDSVRWGLGISGVAWAALLFALRASIWRWLLSLGRCIPRVGRTVGGELISGVGRSHVRGKPEFSAGLSPGERAGSLECRMDSGRLWSLVLILVTLLGFVLRLFRLGFQELSQAEMDTYILNAVSWAESEDVALEGILSTVVGRIWQTLTGSSEFALRSLNAVAGSASVVIVYRLASDLRLSRSVAMMSSLFVAVNALSVWHSQDAQAAGMLSHVLSAASTAIALRFIRTGGRLGTGAGFAACTVLALYANRWAVAVLLVHNLYVVFLIVRARYRPRGRASLLSRSFAVRWLLAQGAVVALTLPWKALPVLPLRDAAGFSEVFSPAVTLLRQVGQLSLGRSLPHSIWEFDAGLMAVAIIVAGVLASTAGRKGGLGLSQSRELEDRERRAPLNLEAQEADPAPGGYCERALLLLYLLIPLIVDWTLGTGGGLAPDYTQLSLTALIPFAILAAIGADGLGEAVERRLGWRWRLWTADPSAGGATALTKVSLGHVAVGGLICLYLAGNLFSLGNHFFDPSFSKSRDLRQLAGRIERWGRGLSPAQVQSALSIYSDSAIPYYHPESVGHSIAAIAPAWHQNQDALFETLHERGFTRVLFPVTAGEHVDQDRLAMGALSRHYRLTTSAQVGRWTLHLFARPDSGLWRPVNVRFENGLTLTRVQVEPERPPEGGILVVHMEWSGETEGLTGGEKAFLHLLDGSGNLIAQWDPELLMDHSPHTVGAAIEAPAALPPGPLRLIGGLYDATVEGAPRIVTESGEDSLTLFSFPDLE